MPPTALTSIQESFFTRAFNLEVVSTYLWGMGAVVFLLLSLTIFRTIRARRVRYRAFGTIIEERTIRGILRNAFDQRRAFEIRFRARNGQDCPTLRCSPEYLGRRSLTIEINGLKTLSDKWLGRPATVFFRLLLDKEFTYYTFTSHIESIHLPRQGVCHITLPIPTALENRQKRSFLRIMPPKEFLLGSAIWCGETLPPDESLNEIAMWPRPKLLLIPGRAEQYQLLDISAGGARVIIPNTVLRMLGLQFAASERLLLILDLFAPEESRRLRFWMQCRVRNAWIEHGTRNMHIGMQFLAWARPREMTDISSGDNAAGIEWLRLSSSNEVEALGNWIMRRHLQVFRGNNFEEFQNASESASIH